MFTPVKWAWSLPQQHGSDVYHIKMDLLFALAKWAWYLPQPNRHDVCHSKMDMMFTMTKWTWCLQWQNGPDVCHNENGLDIYHGKMGLMFATAKRVLLYCMLGEFVKYVNINYLSNVNGWLSSLENITITNYVNTFQGISSKEHIFNFLGSYFWWVGAWKRFWKIWSTTHTLRLFVGHRV